MVTPISSESVRLVTLAFDFVLMYTAHVSIATHIQYCCVVEEIMRADLAVVHEIYVVVPLQLRAGHNNV